MYDVILLICSRGNPTALPEQPLQNHLVDNKHAPLILNQIQPIVSGSYEWHVFIPSPIRIKVNVELKLQQPHKFTQRSISNSESSCETFGIEIGAQTSLLTV